MATTSVGTLEAPGPLHFEAASTPIRNGSQPRYAALFSPDIDRLVHHCHLVTIRGNSFRLRQHTELWQALHAGQDADAAPPRRRRIRPQEAPTT